ARTGRAGRRSASRRRPAEPGGAPAGAARSRAKEPRPMHRPIRLAAALAATVAVVLVAAAGASAHARISPSPTLANQSELYSLVVPTEKEGAFTATVVLT